MTTKKTYVGIHNDEYGGLTPTGNIIRDAWVFGIIPENEHCEGWTLGQIQVLYDKVTEAWAPYGHLVSRLPEDLKLRHAQYYENAVALAREHGWNPELDEND